MYERFLVEPLFLPFAEAMIEQVGLRAGDRLLDVACGTGIVARRAQVRVGALGVVVGVDINPQMLAVARSVAPDVDWREGPADALPLADGEAFDAVTCHQGFQFFPARVAAAREMRRALAPGGRLAVATWRSVDTIPFVAALHQIAERHLGPVADRRHSVTDPAQLHDALAQGGFGDVRIDTVTRTVRFTDGSVFVRLNAMALVGMSAGAKALSDDARADAAARITEDSGDVLRAYTTPDGLAFDISTYVATAQVTTAR
jgi:ubiquinone/menaquinone biosynthesis C-methylase UbiE